MLEGQATGARRRVPVTFVHGWLDGAATAAAVGLAAGAAGAGERPVVLHPGELDRPVPAGVEAHRIDEETAHRSAGCACCAVRLDLIDMLGLLARRRRAPSWVVVAGLPGADPATPVVTLLDDPELSRHVRLDGIVTCLPASLLARRGVTTDEGGGVADPVGDALLLADAVWLINTSSVAAVRVAARLCTMNPLARIMTAPPRRAEAFPLRAWSLDRIPTRLARLVPSGCRGHPARGDSVLLEVAGRLDKDRLEGWLAEVHQAHGPRLLRLEGDLALAGEHRRRLLLGCRTITTTEVGPAWGPDETPTSRLRLVGWDLDAGKLTRGLLLCSA